MPPRASPSRPYASPATTELRSSGLGLVVELAGDAGRQEFHCDSGQADALGRWLVAKAAEYRGAAHAWVVVPPDTARPPDGLAGFDTVEQALAVVAGLSELQEAREVERSVVGCPGTGTIRRKPRHAD